MLYIRNKKYQYNMKSMRTGSLFGVFTLLLGLINNNFIQYTQQKFIEKKIFNKELIILIHLQ